MLKGGLIATADREVPIGTRVFCHEASNFGNGEAGVIESGAEITDRISDSLLKLWRKGSYQLELVDALIKNTVIFLDGGLVRLATFKPHDLTFGIRNMRACSGQLAPRSLKGR